jgi:hypothetical protein
MPEYKLSVTIPVKVAQGDGGGGDGGGGTSTTPSWLPWAIGAAVIVGLSSGSGNKGK